MEVDKETLKKIAAANAANPYADVTPFVLKVGYPEIFYRGVVLKNEEVILYAMPASVYNDKEQVVGYAGKNSGLNVHVAKGVSIRSGLSKGRAIRKNVREFSSGDLVITNKRMIFVAASNGFEINIASIIAAKILDKQSFMIQTKNASKKICTNEALLAYGLAMISHAIKANASGADLYTNYFLAREGITEEQKKQCLEVRQKISKIKIKPKPKGNIIARMLVQLLRILVVIFILLVILMAVIIVSQVKRRGSMKNVVAESSPITSITDAELVLMENHPRVFDDLDSAKSFVDSLADKRINIVYTEAGRTRTIDEEEPYEEAVVTYRREAINKTLDVS